MSHMLAPQLKLRGKRVLLVCSNGGHLLQLVQLRELFSLSERAWVTFDKQDARSLLAGEDVDWAYHPTNRNLPNLIRNLGLARRVLGSYRPDLIVSTGAGVAVPFFWLGRVYGARSIFIESFTRITQPSLTGRLVRRLADLVIYQWEELAEHYPQGVYGGCIYAP